MNTSIDSVRGMRDVLSAEHRHLAQVQAVLAQHFAHYGYHPIDVPIIEHRDLYLRKMGEELVGKIYEFSFEGRELALRPEWTASVLRAYIAHMQDSPLPVRLSYSGPAFRYQRPQRSTYRQFTQTGIELIGGTTPRGDAEAIALACDGLAALNLHDYQILVSHIGVVRQALDQLGLTERTKSTLTWNMSRVRAQGKEVLREKLGEQQSTDLPFDPKVIDGLNDEEATTAVLAIAQTLGLDLSFGSRTPEDIVGRLVRKLRRDDPQPLLDRAIDLLWQLSQIRGTPNEALSQASALFHHTGITVPALQEIRTIFQLIEMHGVDLNRVTLDFGMGRGLYYYTGMIFEIYDTNKSQICGGGRYDDLISALGGRQATPAIGFSYGLERLVSTLSASDASYEAESPLQRVVSVVPISGDDYEYAVHLAQQLRQYGFPAMLDVRERNVTNNMRDANRRGIPYVAIVGEEERQHRCCEWCTLATGDKQRIFLEDLPNLIDHL
jgi:histidyl-tRNA synthetase